MAVIEIIGGRFPNQKAQLVMNQLTVRTGDNGRKVYPITATVKTYKKLAENKNKVLFEMVMADGSTIKGETDGSTAYLLEKHKGNSLEHVIKEVTPEIAKKHDTITIATFTIIIFAVVIYLASGKSEPDKIDPSAPWKHTTAAIDLCEKAALRRLRSPSTAKFGDFRVMGSGSGRTFLSYVDSQNGFGAKIRTHITCGVEEYQGGVIVGNLIMTP
jgi:hypothetical protein